MYEELVVLGLKSVEASSGVELKLYMAIPDANRMDLAAPDSNRTLDCGFII